MEVLNTETFPEHNTAGLIYYFVQSEAFAVKENNPHDKTKYLNAETPPSKNTLARQQWLRERINVSLKKCTGPCNMCSS